MSLVLASTSPRRASFLEKAGLAFTKVDPGLSDQDEEDLAARWRAFGGVSHAEVSMRLAVAKALAAARRAPAGTTRAVAGDTVVTFDGKALGKAKDRAHAKQMIEHLSGRAHEASTGVCVLDLESGLLLAEIETSKVTFKALDDAAVEKYLAANQWQGKAGAYGIQDEATAPLVEKLEGSLSNVAGLPVERVLALLARTGFALAKAEAPKRGSARIAKGKGATSAVLFFALAALAGCPTDASSSNTTGQPVAPPSTSSISSTTRVSNPTKDEPPVNGPRVPHPDDGEPSRGLPEHELVAGGKKITVELALTRDSRRLGLMHRPFMPDDRGMLFVFPEDDRNFRSFWMHNTLLPLSIAYLRDDGTVVNVEDMEPRTDESHWSKERVRLALEMNKGWFKIHGIGPGARIEGVEAVLPRGE